MATIDVVRDDESLDVPRGKSSDLGILFSRRLNILFFFSLNPANFSRYRQAYRYRNEKVELVTDSEVLTAAYPAFLATGAEPPTGRVHCRSTGWSFSTSSLIDTV